MPDKIASEINDPAGMIRKILCALGIHGKYAYSPGIYHIVYGCGCEVYVGP